MYDSRDPRHREVNFARNPNQFFNGKSLNEYFSNSVDPDEVQLNVAFHLGLHCL